MAAARAAHGAAGGAILPAPPKPVVAAIAAPVAVAAPAIAAPAIAAPAIAAPAIAAPALAAPIAAGYGLPAPLAGHPW